jgi:hypothetical protein
MDTKSFELETSEVVAKLPAGFRLAVIGGTSFWHPQSQTTCAELGCLLARLDGLVLVTGGVGGAGEAIGRSFHAARERDRGGTNVFHVLPHGCTRWDYGETLFAGRDMRERREILGRLADVFVAIEGGPGTAHEASVALARSAVVIPIGRSGGASGDLYPRLARPAFAPESAWRDLANADAPPEQVARSAVAIVTAYLGKANGERP